VVIDDEGPELAWINAGDAGNVALGDAIQNDNDECHIGALHGVITRNNVAFDGARTSYLFVSQSVHQLPLSTSITMDNDGCYDVYDGMVHTRHVTMVQQAMLYNQRDNHIQNHCRIINLVAYYILTQQEYNASRRVDA
jgi:hypothetical protein